DGQPVAGAAGAGLRPPGRSPGGTVFHDLRPQPGGGGRGRRPGARRAPQPRRPPGGLPRRHRRPHDRRHRPDRRPDPRSAAGAGQRPLVAARRGGRPRCGARRPAAAGPGPRGSTPRRRHLGRGPGRLPRSAAQPRHQADRARRRPLRGPAGRGAGGGRPDRRRDRRLVQRRSHRCLQGRGDRHRHLVRASGGGGSGAGPRLGRARPGGGADPFGHTGAAPLRWGRRRHPGLGARGARGGAGRARVDDRRRGRDAPPRRARGRRGDDRLPERPGPGARGARGAVASL
ncbi:MAG: Glycerophosphoryl diester phosphodiesterase, partial [uncultured Acidimicrobiales bacterium]